MSIVTHNLLTFVGTGSCICIELSNGPKMFNLVKFGGHTIHNEFLEFSLKQFFILIFMRAIQGRGLPGGVA